MALINKTLLLHSVGVPELGVHTTSSLRSALAPLIGTVLITFDDGYKHTLETVRQLAADGHKIILFLSGMMHESHFLPKDQIQRIVETLEFGGEVKIGPIRQKIISNNPRYRHWLAYKINRVLMAVSSQTEYIRCIEDSVRRYACNLNHCPRYELMSSANVASLLNDFPSIEIGIHGWSHYRLDLLNNTSEYNKEITFVKDLFESAWCRRVGKIAPPYGITNTTLNKRMSNEGYQIHLLNNLDDGYGSLDPIYRHSIDWSYIY